MTNIFYPVSRTIFFAVILAVVSAATVAALAVHSMMHRGVVSVDFTVHDGERIATFWNRLVGGGVATQATLLQIAETEEFPAYAFVPPPSDSVARFEGLFVPGTYHITFDEDSGGTRSERMYRKDLQIVDTLLERFSERLSAFADAAGSPGQQVAYDDIILASIVEKEDVPRSHYDDVASVFLNRMRAGMHLDSCPTLEYALGYHRPFLLNADLSVDSPYNTYRNAGLPPTPICFFSDAALDAVEHPADTPYYFFVLDWVTHTIRFAHDFSNQQRNADIARNDYIDAYGQDSLHEREDGVFYRDVHDDRTRADIGSG
jgi:peptidoglycan lytic transglycosylase G